MRRAFSESWLVCFQAGSSLSLSNVFVSKTLDNILKLFWYPELLDIDARNVFLTRSGSVLKKTLGSLLSRSDSSSLPWDSLWLDPNEATVAFCRLERLPCIHSFKGCRHLKVLHWKVQLLLSIPDYHLHWLKRLSRCDFRNLHELIRVDWDWPGNATNFAFQLQSLGIDSAGVSLLG